MFEQNLLHSFWFHQSRPQGKSRICIMEQLHYFEV